MGRERKLTNSLPFVVQYRRKDMGVYWDDMAAFDQERIAKNYCHQCAGDNIPWEYRVDDRSEPLEPTHD